MIDAQADLSLTGECFGDENMDQPLSPNARDLLKWLAEQTPSEKSGFTAADIPMDRFKLRNAADVKECVQEIQAFNKQDHYCDAIRWEPLGDEFEVNITGHINGIWLAYREWEKEHP